MTKDLPVTPGGKTTKGGRYRPPDVAGLLAEQ